MKLLEHIAGRYGQPSEAAFAPGRVNLIGDHVDYCGGLVMPFAIERGCVAAIYPRVTTEDALVVSSLNQAEEIVVRWDEIAAPGLGAAGRGWPLYVLGVVAGLGRYGPIDRMRGCRIAVASDVPLGAGLSSSAALEVSVGSAVVSRCAIEIDGMTLARVCQRAEQEFAGVPCGIMDQAISVLAREGSFLLLDCATERSEYAAAPEGCECVLVNSGVRHALGDGEYGNRRAACERAASMLGVAHLAHADEASLRALPEPERLFARHVVRETARVRQAADALASGSLQAFGQLLYESHASLRDDLRVSCPEVDALVDAIGRAEGVLGARMTGGGFGGCVVVWAEAGGSGSVRAAAERCSAACPNMAVMHAQASGGARVLTVGQD